MKAGLPEKEPRILAKWQADDAYGQLRAARRGREKFILHDGPPYANGDIHIGHAMQKTLKDLVIRTQSLLGKDVPFVPGWDCHGLPIEWKVEEEYRKHKRNKDEVPVAEFRAECRAYAQKWVDVQREQFKRLGIGGEWDKPYLTMDFSSEAVIVTELLKFAASGQLYRGAKPVMWSPVEKTALAEAEVEYADIVSTQIDVGFEIVASSVAALVGAVAVIWTTTPWTIPVNQALAYGPEIEYVLIAFGEQRVLVAAALQAAAFSRFGVVGDATGGAELAATLDPGLRRDDEGGVIWRGLGAELAATVARHPLHHLGGFFARPRPFLAGDFVTTDAGTGLVHMAPDHGEDDFILCKAHGIEPVFAVEGDGTYRTDRPDWLWLLGMGNVISDKLNNPQGAICSALRDAGALLAASPYAHSYPHSWRSKKKVIFRCTPQWFIPMDARSIAEQRWESEGGAVNDAEDSPMREGLTLRETAVAAIADTRFIPEKGRNRLGSMVAGRPDWVISRQRAWGVPITLFVDRKSGAYLNDAAVNARIVAAVAERGVDAWTEEAAQGLLGNDYNAADYERVTDILDVWFDSGCTHAFVLESGRWPDLSWPADLYLEGSDQHRGWFQSSLLESCGTRGRAPYKAVLTHGMTLDAKGFKQSKSLGNTTDPAILMKDYGADIVRLWTATSDTTEDHRIGDEILKGVADQYRKLRNTFRYLLGALDGFDEAERVAAAEMPELERWVLHRLAELDVELRARVGDFDFSGYVTAISTFVNNDLSAFVFDVRKDSLYCDAAGDAKRRAYRTVLDTLFHVLTRWLAPVLVFTGEEVWGTRFPEGGSVHLLEWPAVEAGWRDEALAGRIARLRVVRDDVYLRLEALRRDKTIGSFLEAGVDIEVADEDLFVELSTADLAEMLIVGRVTVRKSGSVGVSVGPVGDEKCARCWRHLPDVVVETGLCGRCASVVNG
ncbi:isoleucine--tRNA ligase [Polymorphobacter glacialis]|uniref:Isoleucine--tRNA ligase n=2 Tax=Sandarakinorhabdus glacialis TaxID=1614636 RepID=A0A916ZX06_9SPHN|nr:isoleucine--tRNA ligase [Polymorphobacter glacialis]